MNPLKQLLRQVAGRCGADGWAVVGGLAISARVEPRFTRDLDAAVAVENDEQAEALVFSFRQEGFRLLALVEQESANRLATARLAAPGESGVVLDLLFASSGIEPEIVRDAGPLEVASGLVVPVAQVWHLLAMKVLARDDRQRPQDLLDLRNLLTVMSAEDLAKAREALFLITGRGFHRGKDLLADLQDLLAGEAQ